MLEDNVRKSGQEMQDLIFRSMSAQKKLALGSQLWKLAVALVPEKLHYGAQGSFGIIRSYRKNS